jgi:heme exporter protein A
VQIIAEHLVIVRGARTIIEDLSFETGSGEAVLLTGENGAGKTTLLRALAGFLRIESGTLRLSGGDDEKSLAEQAHVVGHGNAVKTAFSVRENLMFWAEYDGVDDVEARITAALAGFGLTDLSEFPAAYLSAGQKRRLGLARLLVTERPIWLLDEPTSSLDAASSELVTKAINAHTSNGGIAIAATHLPLGLDRARDLRLTRRKAAA